MKFMVVVLLAVVASCAASDPGSGAKDKRSLYGESLGYGAASFGAYGAAPIGVYDGGLALGPGIGGPIGHGQELLGSVVVHQKEVAVGIPQPYPVPVEKPVPYAVKVAVPVPVEKPVPYAVDRPYPVPVVKHVPVPYKVKVPVEVPVPYPVEKIVHVPEIRYKYIEKPLPVRITIKKSSGWKSGGWSAWD